MQMELPNLDGKCMNFIENCFLVQNMNECRNTMLHQILSDRRPSTLLESKKMDWTLIDSVLNLFSS